METVTDQYQNARRMIADVIVNVSVMVLVPSIRHIVEVLWTGSRAGAVNVRMGMPPQHQFLDDEEHSEPHEEREADAMRAIRTRAHHGFRQEREQGRSEQCTGRETDEVRQDASAVIFAHP